MNNHVSSAKHKAAKRLDKKQQHEIDICEALQQEVYSKGKHLSDQTKVYCVKVVQAFLKAGIPPTNLDSFHDLLEEFAFSLSSSHTLDNVGIKVQDP